MSERPWVVYHIVTELGRQPTLDAAQALADAAGPGVASATHAVTGERWLRANGTWRQTQKGAGPPEPAAPPRPWRADIDGPP